MRSFALVLCLLASSLARAESPSEADIKAVQKACAAGAAEPCYQLGVLLYTGTGLPKDPPRAAGHFGRACDGGFGEACFLLGQMHALGEGVAKDRTRAVALFATGCSLGDSKACAVLEQMKKLAGAGSVEQSREAALVSIEQRCSKAASDKEKSDCSRVAESFRKGCASGNPSSCEGQKRLEAAMKPPKK